MIAASGSQPTVLGGRLGGSMTSRAPLPSVLLQPLGHLWCNGPGVARGLWPPCDKQSTERYGTNWESLAERFVRTLLCRFKETATASPLRRGRQIQLCHSRYR